MAGNAIGRARAGRTGSQCVRTGRETRAMSTPDIAIPDELLPADGRFGCGPSRIRPEAIEMLEGSAGHFLGTSHRQAAVQFKVSELRNGLAELFALPDGYEVLLGNGGTTAFWDAATFGLIESRSQHLSFGEFSSKFADGCRRSTAPRGAHRHPGRAGRPPRGPRRGGCRRLLPDPQRDLDRRRDAARRPDGGDDDALVLVDATSAAGGLRFDPAQVDVYYFAPQKCLASDGGLWLAACSPARSSASSASRRRTGGSRRSSTSGIALENSRKDQTYNTPALATLFLATEQIRWILENGGLDFAAGRCDASAETIYDWADAHRGGARS